MKQDFEKDEKLDAELINSLKDKEPKEMAKTISEKLSRKYGHEFGGYLRVNYDFVEEIYTIEYGSKKKEQIAKNEISEIPERIRFQRELTNKRSKN